MENIFCNSILIFLCCALSFSHIKCENFIKIADNDYTNQKHEHLIRKEVSILNSQPTLLQRLPVFVQNNEIFNFSIYSYIADHKFTIHSTHNDETRDDNVIILRYPSTPLPFVSTYFVLVELNETNAEKRNKYFYGGLAYIRFVFFFKKNFQKIPQFALHIFDREFYSPSTVEWGIINSQATPYYGKDSFISALIYRSGFSSPRRRNRRGTNVKFQMKNLFINI